MLFCSVKAGVNWKQLTEAEKGPYEQLAEVDRDRYKEAMKEYNLVRTSLSLPTKL